MNIWYGVTMGVIQQVEVLKETEKMLLIKGSCKILGDYRVRKGGGEGDTKYVKDFEEAKRIVKENLNNRVEKAEQRLDYVKQLRQNVFERYQID